jgi:hypothetical protein
MTSSQVVRVAARELFAEESAPTVRPASGSGFVGTHYGQAVLSRTATVYKLTASIYEVLFGVTDYTLLDSAKTIPAHVVCVEQTPDGGYVPAAPYADSPYARLAVQAASEFEAGIHDFLSGGPTNDVAF